MAERPHPIAAARDALRSFRTGGNFVGDVVAPVTLAFIGGVIGTAAIELTEAEPCPPAVADPSPEAVVAEEVVEPLRAATLELLVHPSVELDLDAAGDTRILEFDNEASDRRLTVHLIGGNVQVNPVDAPRMHVWVDEGRDDSYESGMFLMEDQNGWVASGTETGGQVYTSQGVDGLENAERAANFTRRFLDQLPVDPLQPSC